jgi:hypothetical protein
MPERKTPPHVSGTALTVIDRAWKLFASFAFVADAPPAVFGAASNRADPDR